MLVAPALVTLVSLTDAKFVAGSIVLKNTGVANLSWSLSWTDVFGGLASSLSPTVLTPGTVAVICLCSPGGNSSNFPGLVTQVSLLASSVGGTTFKLFVGLTKAGTTTVAGAGFGSLGG